MASNHNLAGEVMLIFLPCPEDGSVAWPDSDWIAATESRYPGLQVRWPPHKDPVTGHPRTPEQLPLDIWDGVTILCSSWVPPAHLLSKARYLQIPSSGADKWLSHETYLNPDVTVCTGNGCHAPPIGEWVIGCWLMWRKNFLAFASYMKTGAGFEKQGQHKMLESTGTRVGILGYGALGRHIARLCTALGMEVYAYTRGERATIESRRDDSFCVPGTGDPAGELPAKWFHGSDADSINHFLAQDLDLLVLSTPLTAATSGLLGKDQFAVLQAAADKRAEKEDRRTYVINVARGKVIDTDSLLSALVHGQIAGAALDVTDPEPLPSEHPLWHAPNVFITPHLSWQSRQRWPRTLMILDINLQRLVEGKPLINAVNKEHNY